MRFYTLLLVLGAVCLGACDADGGRRAPTFHNYVETGDVDALARHGVLRLLAPRFDQGAALPRDGFPLSSYREAAEDFARSLGLRPQWVYVDDFADLLPALVEGRGDLVATHLADTAAREQRVAFSLPLVTVDEVLIVPRTRADLTLDTLAGIAVAVPEGTAVEETAQALAGRDAAIAVRRVSGSLSAADLVDGVASGRYQATILDSNLAQILIEDDGPVAIGPTLKTDRHIAWALRRNNPKLQQRLDDFLTAVKIVMTRRSREHRDWQAIRRAGVLRVVTSNSPASYFVWRGELMGFDYDLIKAFARRHRLRVAVVVREGIDAIYQALEQGEGDVIAASVTQTAQRVQRGWIFTHPYLQVTEQIVGRSAAAPLQQANALAGHTIGVDPRSAHLRTLLALRARGVALVIREVADATAQSLVAGVAAGDYDYTILDSHLAAMETAARDDVGVALDLGQPEPIAWVVRQDQPETLVALNAFIDRYYKGLDYNVHYNRYFVRPRTIARYDEHRVRRGEAISPYDKIVRQQAAQFGLDWRLVLAQMYQESRFDPRAESAAGAVGLMQVLPESARQLNVHGDLRKPEVNIAAGLTLLGWLQERFPDRLPLEVRLYFALAAYNAGPGHVEDARVLAQRLGKDPDRWFDNVEAAMLQLSHSRYARHARFGYVRGIEPVTYVRNIRQRYTAYLQATGALEAIRR